MTTKEQILEFIRVVNQTYHDRGFEIVSLFGSFAKDEADPFSDIDMAYKIDHNKFYKDDAFAKLQELENIKQLFYKRFKRKVDLIPFNSINQIIKDSIIDEMVIV